MAALTFGKRDVAKMVQILDAEYDTVEQAAAAALKRAEEIIAAKAKFTAVGQLHHPTGHLDPDEARSNMVALGWYATQNQADAAALQLVYSMQTREIFRTWTLPIFHGTPAAYYSERKHAREAAELALAGGKEAELARRVQWFKDNPDTEPPAWGPIWKTEDTNT